MYNHNWNKYNRSVAFALAVVAFFVTGPVAADTTQTPPGEKATPDVFSRIEDAGTKENHDGANHVIVYDYAKNHVKDTGVTYVESHIIYKVLTPAGCRDQSVLRWNFDPQSMFIEVREVNIVRGS